MATLTSTACAAGVQPKAIHAGVNAVTVQYSSATTEISPSATTVFLVKVPHGATITSIDTYHTTGAATCPMDIGIHTTLDAFGSALTQGTTAQLRLNLPHTVSVSDDATTRFQIVKGTVTPGTATASVKINVTVNYTMG